jgi:hypothetical protein
MVRRQARRCRRLPVQERTDVVGEQLGVLIEEAMVRVLIDPEVGVGEAL